MEPGFSETRPGSSSNHLRDIHGFAPGTILAERYRIVARIGRGGMGEVYRADDLRLRQPVALKFLPPALERDLAAHDRLLAEVRSARMVSHPNVCRVYDVGQIGGATGALASVPPDSAGHGRLFLTMEYIDGEDLGSLLQRIGRLPAAKALEIARQLCAGLAAAHDKGILHRDLKPANVMIDGRGRARITDFGLAVETERGTSPADFAGTLAYLAPERFSGTPATVQSDLYALGLILYEAYTGRTPFAAATLEEWQRAHRDSTPSAPSLHVRDIEPAVERAILHCLAKDPEKRPGSAAQVAAALPGGDPLAAALAAGETPSPELVAASGKEGTLPRSKAWLWFAASLAPLVVAVLLIAPVSLINLSPQPHSPDWLETRAREILQRLGHDKPPADSAWLWEAEARPDIAGFGASSDPVFPALRFAYRQSPAALVPGTNDGSIQLINPAPQWPDEAQVVLDPEGRLRMLKVGGLSSQVGDRAGPPTTPDWTPLFDTAELSTVSLEPAEPEWLPTFYAETRAAWIGRSGGETYRVEAAARSGVLVYFELGRTDRRARERPVSVQGWLRFVRNMYYGGILGVFIVLAVLARRNILLGRGDRQGAFRCAQFVFACLMARQILGWHWNMDLVHLRQDVAHQLGEPSFYTFGAWLLYVGLEPYTRRRWPHLLIAWTRLLDGRWRDGLVGQSMLIGVAAGAACGICLGAAVMTGRILHVPGTVPIYHWQWFAVTWLLGIPGYYSCLWLVALGLLLVGRLLFRRDSAAWAALGILVMDAWMMAFASLRLPMVLALSAAAVNTAIALLVLRRFGLLAVLAATVVGTALLTAPLTVDPSRWYAGLGWIVVAVIAALAFWGFRNVLGRQSAFPAGMLDR